MPLSPSSARLALPGIVFTGGSRRVEPQQLQVMLSALPGTDHGRTHETATTSFAQAGGQSCQSGDLSVVLLGAPYWARQPQGLNHGGDDMALQIAAAYRQHGEQLLGHLGGPFALLIVDAAADQTIAAVDRFAREPLYWQGDGASLVLASTADALLTHPGLTRQLSDQGLFNYLFFHMVPGPDSIYADIHKIPAAHYLRWRADDVQLRCYWLPQFSEQTDDQQALSDGVIETLRQAVIRNTSGPDTGAFLSGGLDSSTVAGLLAGAQPAADTYSIGFDADGYDEIAYARIAAQHFGNTGHEYYVTPEDVLQALPLVAAAYDEPFGNSSALPALFCAQLAHQDGKRRLLAGDGGDELYAGNARYAKQQVFEIFQRLPTAMQRLLQGVSRAIPQGTPLLGKVRSYVQQASVPLPDRLQTYNFIFRLGVDTMFTPDFAASVDSRLPFALERDIYHRPDDADVLNRMLYLDWYHTLADNDLRKVGRMCALGGIEVRYPMLDEGVVEHSTRIPSILKLPARQLRGFYKRAAEGFLPDAILNKPKHGFGLPFGVWMADHAGLREMAHDNLARLRRRGILRADFIDQALRLHEQSHAGYYGELVWVMMMLELWLTSRGMEP